MTTKRTIPDPIDRYNRHAVRMGDDSHLWSVYEPLFSELEGVKTLVGSSPVAHHLTARDAALLVYGERILEVLRDCQSRLDTEGEGSLADVEFARMQTILLISDLEAKS